jgi:hypothetical protein
MIGDWKKYKRFFAFGCSYTRYIWPTWADIVSKSMPDAEFYNLGRSGGGNPFISYRVAEANNRFKFTDTDLIMILFSSYTREDRWVESSWQSFGNVYQNSYYDDAWCRKYADERGYMIRDAAVIDMTLKYVDSMPCDSYSMLSVPFVTEVEDNNNGVAPEDIATLYKDTFGRFKPSFKELEIMPNPVLDYSGFQDGHPATIRHYNYLSKLGFALSDASKQFAEESTETLKTIKARNLVPTYFPEQDNMISLTDRIMF